MSDEGNAPARYIEELEAENAKLCDQIAELMDERDSYRSRFEARPSAFEYDSLKTELARLREENKRVGNLYTETSIELARTREVAYSKTREADRLRSQLDVKFGEGYNHAWREREAELDRLHEEVDFMTKQYNAAVEKQKRFYDEAAKLREDHAGTRAALQREREQHCETLNERDRLREENKTLGKSYTQERILRAERDKFKRLWEDRKELVDAESVGLRAELREERVRHGDTLNALDRAEDEIRRLRRREDDR